MNNPQRHLLKIYHFMSLPCLNPLETSFSLKKIQTPFPGFQGPTDLISIHFSDRISLCLLHAPHCFTASGPPSASHVPSQLCTCLRLYSSLGRKVTSSGRPSPTTSLLLSCKPTTLFSQLSLQSVIFSWERDLVFLYPLVHGRSSVNV